MATLDGELVLAEDYDLAGAVKVIKVANLTRRYGDRTILDSIGLTIAEGEFVALLGRSGSGKSTLLRALAGIDHDVEGSGTVAIPSKRAVIFQDARLLPWARVLGNITLGLPASAREQAIEVLHQVGLSGRERAWPKDLSGGEQQRVALARALVRDPAVLLADEPFGALDALTRLRMHALLRRLCETYRPAVVLVTHDVDEAILLADRVLVLEGGRIQSDIAVTLSHRRRGDAERFEHLRNQLLRALGVDELS